MGLYFGYEKPKDSNVFLSNFVTEATDLINNGIVINQIKKKVMIYLYFCDSPAKSYVLRIKGHSGSFSCTQCTIEGEYFYNRVCFPYSNRKASKRTHEAYVNVSEEDFHVNSTSILNSLPEFDSVNNFPSDYMHLVWLKNFYNYG